MKRDGIKVPWMKEKLDALVPLVWTIIPILKLWKLIAYLHVIWYWILSWLFINPFLYRLWLTSILTLHRLCLLSDTTCVISGAAVAYPSGAPELTLFFVGFRFSFKCSVVCYVCLSFHFVGYVLAWLQTKRVLSVPFQYYFARLYVSMQQFSNKIKTPS